MLRLTLLLALLAADAAVYSTDFSKLAPGKLPDDEFLPLAGEFAVKDVDGGRVLELPGTPLESFGVLFGPAPDGPANTVSARIWGATTGRRFPEFGVGSNDAGGYKLWLMPRRQVVAVRKGDETVATAPYAFWKTGGWTQFRLAVTKSGDAKWTVRGKVWPAGAEEPKDWAVAYDDAEEPAPGRASVWGNPYSGQPIRFDDLRVER